MVIVYKDGVEIQSTPVLSDYSVFFGYLVEAGDGGQIVDITIYAGGRVDVAGGSADGVTMKAGALSVGDGGTASNVYLELHDATALVEDGGIITGLTIDGATVTVQGGGLLSNSNIRSYTWMPAQGGEEQFYQGVVHLESGARHAGSLYISKSSLLVAETGAIIDFTLKDTAAGSATPILNNFTRISGTPDFTMTVSEEQTAGVYALAGNATDFSAPLTLHCGDYAAMLLGIGETVTYHCSVYSLGFNGGTLTATVAAYQTAASASGLYWADINDAAGYVLELGHIQLDVATPSVDLLGLSNGDYAWRVRNAAEADNWQTGKMFSQTEAAEEPQKLEAVTNGATDLFFAKADGVWYDGFMAQHVGNKGGWTGTGETVALAGKARITDIFAGSEDASILACSVPEAQASGVALFLDDIYSTCPVPEAKASGRLSQINTILATEGADIIDLTSQRFDFAGGVTVHGNGGDDVIWANSGENTLFGGDGDDYIIGGSGNDIIIGGAGDDTLHGGGGSDIFCFGEAWGNDTVSQLAGENDAVTLWFSQSNDILQLSFTPNSGDTIVTASTGDTIRAIGMSVTFDDCRFGAAAGYETKYNSLASAGVFA